MQENYSKKQDNNLLSRNIAYLLGRSPVILKAFPIRANLHLRLDALEKHAIQQHEFYL